MGVASEKQAEKPTKCVWKPKNRQKNPKLEAKTRKWRAIWVQRVKSKQKNPRGVFGSRKTGEKNQNRKLNQESGEQSVCSG